MQRPLLACLPLALCTCASLSPTPHTLLSRRYFVPAFLNGSVPRWRSFVFLLVSFISNFIGAVVITYLLGFQADYFSHDPARAFVIANAEKKCNLGFGVALLRGVGANLLVCLGWWQALSAKRDDTISKIFAVWWCVHVEMVLVAAPCCALSFSFSPRSHIHKPLFLFFFFSRALSPSRSRGSFSHFSLFPAHPHYRPTFTFTAIGFEHSIANMWYVDIGLMVGANASFGQFLWRNLVPVVIGNFIGGAGLGLAQYAAYDSRGLKLQVAWVSARCCRSRSARRRDGDDDEAAINVA